MNLKTNQPVRLLIITITSSFLAEIVVAAFFDVYPPVSKLVDILASAVFSTGLILPVLYIFLLRPLMTEIARREQVERALQRAHDQLELRVQERTEELAQANQSLQDRVQTEEVLRADLVQLVEELKTAQQKLVEQNEELYRLAAIVESSDDAIIGKTLDGTIISWNLGAERIYGYAKKEALGESISILAPKGLTDEIPVMMERISQGDQYRHYETLRTRKDGKNIQVSLTISPIIDGEGNIVGASSIARDITERKNAEEELRKAYEELGLLFKEQSMDLGKAISELQREISARKKIEEQLRLQTTALEAAANGVFITDAEGRIQWSNPAFSLLTGYSRESILGQTPRILKSGVQDQEYYQQLWKTIGAGKVWQNEIVNRRADGSFYYEEQTITPVLDENGKINHFIAIQHDISERKQAEANIRERNQKLEELYQSELRARQIAETLRSASLALTQTLSLPTVANTLLEYVAQLVPYQDASVVLLESDELSKVWAVNGYTQVADPITALDAYFRPKSNPFIQFFMAQGKSLLVPDTSQQSDWIPLPGLEDIRTWLGMPLFAGGRMIGFCELSQPGTQAFTEKHIQWIEALASQSAVVIQNSWLFEQVRAGHERLQSLSRRLVEIQENERRYIARDLHDEAGQMLTSLMIGLELLERDAHDPQSVIAGIAELNRLVDEVLDDLHRLAVDLRPVSLDHLGLVAALRQYVETLSDKHNLMFSFQVLGITERLPAELETTLYRIVQEALTNVIRHAHASRVDVLLEQRSDQVIAMIEDNGVGFEPLSQTHSDQLGLFGMRERVEMLNGTIRVDSSAGNGTTIFVEVPYDDPDSGRR